MKVPQRQTIIIKFIQHKKDKPGYMAAIPFTSREMQKAWKDNLQASRHTSRNNAHRLLLFYAIECGLKAILMKRRSVTCTSDCIEISQAQHNINKLLDFLRAGHSLKLPNQFDMAAITNKGKRLERKVDSGTVNQMWRYGGKAIESIDPSGKTIGITDNLLEKHLIKISEWIEKAECVKNHENIEILDLA